MLLVNPYLWIIPSSDADKTQLRYGLQYENNFIIGNIYHNYPSTAIETSAVFKARSNILAGFNISLGTQKLNVDKYDFDLNWEPTTGAFLGIKHESTSKETIKPGKFIFFFHHIISNYQTVGTEFAFDYQKRAVAAKLGLLHKFNDTTSGKIKLNQAGYVDVALKHKFSELLTAGVVTGASLHGLIAEQKTKSLPIGLSLDLKF